LITPNLGEIRVETYPSRKTNLLSWDAQFDQRTQGNAIQTITSLKLNISRKFWAQL